MNGLTADSGRLPDAPVRPSLSEQFHAWMMDKKHGYLVEAGKWKKAGASGMVARLEGKSSAMAEALRQLESMLARPNGQSAPTRRQ